MPIYEYRCPACDERFEELVRGPDAAVACPGCGGAEVERLLSTFAGVGGLRSAAVADATPVAATRAAGCGPGCACHH